MKFRALAVAIAGLLAVVGASPALADDSYRYWSYWLQTDGAWVMAETGPSDQNPADGSVQGWRFSITGATDSDEPRYAPAFESVCAGTPSQEGRKRVALFVDPGEAAAAPDGETPPGPWATCVVAPPEASGYDVLRSAASVRVEDGLTCAINDYPRVECAVAVAAPEATPAPEPTPSLALMADPAAPSDDAGSGSVLAVALAALVIIVIAGAAVVLARRGRT